MAKSTHPGHTRVCGHVLTRLTQICVHSHTHAHTTQTRVHTHARTDTPTLTHIHSHQVWSVPGAPTEPLAGGGARADKAPLPRFALYRRCPPTCTLTGLRGLWVRWSYPHRSFLSVGQAETLSTRGSSWPRTPQQGQGPGRPGQQEGERETAPEPCKDAACPLSPRPGL